MEAAQVSVQTMTAASSAAVILDSHYKVTAKRVLVCEENLSFCGPFFVYESLFYVYKVL